MPNFHLRFADMIRSPIPHLTDVAIEASVSYANESYQIYKDRDKDCLVAQCANKPRPLLVWGLWWREASGMGNGEEGNVDKVTMVC